jgi:hypothetical protein
MCSTPTIRFTSVPGLLFPQNGVPPGPPPLSESHFEHSLSAEYMNFARAIGAATVDLFQTTRDVSSGVTGTRIQPRPDVSPKDVIEAVVSALGASVELSHAAEQLFGPHVHEVASLLTVMSDDLSQLALPVSAPGSTATGVSMSPLIDAAPMAWWSGEDEVQYLGSSAASGDFNADGFPDVAIGSYGATTVGMPQVCCSRACRMLAPSTLNGKLHFIFKRGIVYA